MQFREYILGPYIILGIPPATTPWGQGVSEVKLGSTACDDHLAWVLRYEHRQVYVYPGPSWLWSPIPEDCSVFSNGPVDSETVTACEEHRSSCRAVDMESTEQLLTMLDREEISLWLESDKLSDLVDGVSVQPEREKTSDQTTKQGNR